MDEELKKLLAERNALFHNPTLEAAKAHWTKMEFPLPVRDDVPLAMVHKARLQWLDATDAMLAESVKWLEDNGYKSTHFDAPPLTPETRDAQRVELGKKPLGGSNVEDS
jgi:hypothetical protein